MKKSRLYQLMGFASTSLLGTLLHFLYDWTNSIYAAPFSGVNESTWEHMKLLYWPMLAYALIQSLFFKDREDFWCVKLRSILLGLVLIPVIFYTYNGAISKSPDWLNIAIFFISAFAAYTYEAMLFRRKNLKCKYPKLSFIIFITIGILFVIFTFKPPMLGVFKDPLSGGYGMPQ